MSLALIYLKIPTECGLETVKRLRLDYCTLSYHHCTDRQFRWQNSPIYPNHKNIQFHLQDVYKVRQWQKDAFIICHHLSPVDFLDLLKPRSSLAQMVQCSELVSWFRSSTHANTGLGSNPSSRAVSFFAFPSVWKDNTEMCAVQLKKHGDKSRGSMTRRLWRSGSCGDGQWTFCCVS